MKDKAVINLIIWLSLLLALGLIANHEHRIQSLEKTVFSPPTEPVAEVAPTEAPVHSSSSPSSEAAGDMYAAFTFDDLLDAIEWVESKGDANAVGDDGDAVGAYQLHKIYVDDVNRIVDENIYCYEDRWDKKCSREMTGIYIRYYGFKFFGDPRDGNKGPPFEAMARIHNGGPKGYLKESTKAYWAKVKARMEAE